MLRILVLFFISKTEDTIWTSKSFKRLTAKVTKNAELSTKIVAGWFFHVWQRWLEFPDGQRLHLLLALVEKLLVVLMLSDQDHQRPAFDSHRSAQELSRRGVDVRLQLKMKIIITSSSDIFAKKSPLYFLPLDGLKQEDQLISFSNSILSVYDNNKTLKWDFRDKFFYVVVVKTNTCKQFLKPSGGSTSGVLKNTLDLWLKLVRSLVIS